MQIILRFFCARTDISCGIAALRGVSPSEFGVCAGLLFSSVRGFFPGRRLRARAHAGHRLLVYLNITGICRFGRANWYTSCLSGVYVVRRMSVDDALFFPSADRIAASGFLSGRNRIGDPGRSGCRRRWLICHIKGFSMPICANSGSKRSV